MSEIICENSECKTTAGCQCGRRPFGINFTWGHVKDLQTKEIAGLKAEIERLRKDLEEASRMSAAPKEVPTAWMRSIPPVSTPDGPGEWEVDFSYGEDEPVSVAGQSWVPLYAAPPQAEGGDG